MAGVAGASVTAQCHSVTSWGWNLPGVTGSGRPRSHGGWVLLRTWSESLASVSSLTESVQQQNLLHFVLEFFILERRRLFFVFSALLS